MVFVVLSEVNYKPASRELTLAVKLTEVSTTLTNRGYTVAHRGFLLRSGSRLKRRHQITDVSNIMMVRQDTRKRKRNTKRQQQRGNNIKQTHRQYKTPQPHGS